MTKLLFTEVSPRCGESMSIQVAVSYLAAKLSRSPAQQQPRSRSRLAESLASRPAGVRRRPSIDLRERRTDSGRCDRNRRGGFQPTLLTADPKDDLEKVKLHAVELAKRHRKV